MSAVAEAISAPTTLALSQVTRSFGPVQILFDIHFDLHPGEVHALIGENGAGKSTMMKILSGYLQPTSGDVVFEGQNVTFAGSQAAEEAGVVLIHQEFNLAETLSVEQNIFLGRELKKGFLLDHAEMRAQTLALLKQLETDVDPSSRVSDISVSDKQMVEIAKALSRKARVLIMDEPTAVLTTREAEVLFRQIDRLRTAGTAILFTSHKLDEVARIADRITVLRDGHQVISAPAGDMSEDDMARQMVGRDLTNLFPQIPHEKGAEPVLAVEKFSVGAVVSEVSFDLRPGEILGFAGLVGSGRTELMEGLMGLREAIGVIRVRGVETPIGSVKKAAELGIAYLTEDRKGRGLIVGQQMRPNLTLASLGKFSKWLIDRNAEETALDHAIEEFDIRAPTREVKVGNLSGGNQQKLLLAKVMLGEPEIVIIDEPTRGIDIGTKQQIYEFIAELAKAGKSVIVISSEMAEIIGLSDRVVVMRTGRVSGILEGENINEDSIVRYAMGLEGGVENS